MHVVGYFYLYELKPKYLLNTPPVPNCMTFWTFYIYYEIQLILCEKDIMSCFIKLSVINNMGKINEWIERRE